MSEEKEVIKRDYSEQLIGTAQSLAIHLSDDPLARARLARYVKYLLADAEERNYADLTRFLEWYGTKYTLPKIVELLTASELRRVYSTVVEFGPGTGWLIGALANYFPNAYAIEKRPELWERRRNVILMPGDLESRIELTEFRSGFPDDTLVVANQFLHCVDNAEEIVTMYRRFGWIVIEVDEDLIFPDWGRQMAQFGATPIKDDDLERLFLNAGLKRTWRIPIAGQNISVFEAYP